MNQIAQGIAIQTEEEQVGASKLLASYLGVGGHEW